jgi:hypothetical protein
MAKKQVINATPKVAAEFTKLFGPPPLLKPEDIVIYAAILEGLAQDEKPRSFIARVLLRDVADLVYQRLWLGRLGTRLIRQAHKEKLQASALLAETEADLCRKTIHENHARLSVKPKADVPNANKSESGADKSESEAEKAKAELAKIDAAIELTSSCRIARACHATARRRRTQRMPLTARRLLSIAGPHSPRSGSSGSRMRHCSSVRSPRLNAASFRNAALNQNSIPLSKTVNTA